VLYILVRGVLPMTLNTATIETPQLVEREHEQVS